MHTERFIRLRKSVLNKVLEKDLAVKIWRVTVRNQLRSMDIKDVYDHYDFNINIEERIQTLKNAILDGSYSVGTPLIYKTEKKYGICRHMVIPQPEEALILQCLIEHISEEILKKQPSSNAFYSRDKHNVKKPHEAIEYGMSFREQWKALQKKIYNFTNEFDYIVVTDLTNYFDSIDLRELRRVFVSNTNLDEVIIDLVFKIVEGLSWRPDYLPYSHRGLPTANVEPIRLLGHSFLFEVDQILKERTNENFARWMDDITCGVDDKRKGIALLSDISDVIKSRGLAFNLSKTKILSAQEAFFEFQIEKNLEIDAYEKIKPGTPQSIQAEKELWVKYRNHFKDKSAKSWDKIAKRYITTFGKFKSRRLLNGLAFNYIANPGLRSNYLIYLSTCGYSKKSSEVVLEILNKLDPFDDISLYQISNLLTQWKVPFTDKAKHFISEVDNLLTRHAKIKKDPISFYSLLWFKSKYNNGVDLFKFLDKYRNIWQNNSFLRRQATACLGRFDLSKEQKRLDLLDHQLFSGMSTTVSVANQIKQFSKIETISFNLNAYLFPTTLSKYYPHAKFIVLCSVLSSVEIRKKDYTLSKLKDYIKDPWHIFILKDEFNLNIK